MVKVIDFMCFVTTHSHTHTYTNRKQIVKWFWIWRHVKDQNLWKEGKGNRMGLKRIGALRCRPYLRLKQPSMLSPHPLPKQILSPHLELKWSIFIPSLSHWRQCSPARVWLWSRQVSAAETASSSLKWHLGRGAPCLLLSLETGNTDNDIRGK